MVFSRMLLIYLMLYKSIYFREGCGHGIDSSEGESVDSTIDVMGVDGPLANAIKTLRSINYKIIEW